jgi:hypothetical protein
MGACPGARAHRQMPGRGTRPVAKSAKGKVQCPDMLDGCIPAAKSELGELPSPKGGIVEDLRAVASRPSALAQSTRFDDQKFSRP